MAGQRTTGGPLLLIGGLVLTIGLAAGFVLGQRSNTVEAGEGSQLQSAPVDPQPASEPSSPRGVTSQTVAEPTTSAQPTTETTTGPMATAGEERVYVLTGGTVTVSFAGGTARIVDAVPAEGFTVDQPAPEADGTVTVNFRNETLHSELQAGYDGGPQVRLDDH